MKFLYTKDQNIDLDQLKDGANLALHHHMAPPGKLEDEEAGKEFEYSKEDDFKLEDMSDQANLALHHHMAPPGKLEEDNEGEN